MKKVEKKESSSSESSQKSKKSESGSSSGSESEAEKKTKNMQNRSLKRVIAKPTQEIQKAKLSTEVYYQDEEKQLYIDIKSTVFPTMNDFQKGYIEKMNALYPKVPKDKKPYSVVVTEKYVNVKCGICKKYQIWFTYEGDHSAKKYKNIKFFRVINQQHFL